MQFRIFQWRDCVTVAVLGIAVLACTKKSVPVDAGPLDMADVADVASVPVDAGPLDMADVADVAGDAAVDVAQTPGTPFRFIVYGDTRTQHDKHKLVLASMAGYAPQLVLHVGDLEDSYSDADLTTWLNLIKQQPRLSDLIAKHMFLVARGNHDLGVESDSRWPTLSRQPGNVGTSERYSFVVDRAFIVVMGLYPGDAAYLTAELKKPEARNATWRFVVSHVPIYNSGRVHRATGLKAIEDVCDAYGVDIFYSGHAHLHELSYQMKGGQIVDRDAALQAGLGTVYVIEGGGGAPLYPVDAPLPSSRFSISTHGFQVVDMDDASLKLVTRDIDGKVLDQLAIRR